MSTMHDRADDVMDTSDPEMRVGNMYSAHRRALDEYFRRRLPVDLVSDAVSDVFAVAWRRHAHIPDGSELPWLYGIARNVMRNQRRGLNRRNRLGGKLSAMRSPSSADVESVVVRNADERMVLEALALLGSADQELLRLRAWEELSSADIAVALGISSAAVDMRLTRAKRRLAASLRAVGYSTSSVQMPRTAGNGDTS